MAFDAAGNLNNDTYTGQGQRTYDAENRMTQGWANGQWQIYTYNADGRRVRRKVNGVETWQMYGFDGEFLAEYAANGSPSSAQKEYGSRNGQLLVTAEPGAQIQWLVPDHLLRREAEYRCHRLLLWRLRVDPVNVRVIFTVQRDERKAQQSKSRLKLPVRLVTRSRVLRSME